MSVPVRLITIPASHYCEKARWALERARIPFIEEGHIPLLDKLLRRDAGTVPVLRTPEGTLRDSTDILRWADSRSGAGLYAAPEAAELEDHFDQKLGPATRRMYYFHLMPERELLETVLSERVPPAERVALRTTYPLIIGVMRRAMRIDSAGAARSRAQAEGIFAEVGARLRDGRRYLCGPDFSAADLSFAALAAPLLHPERYGVPLPELSRLPAALRELIERLRATPAGAFALRIYREDRA